MLLKDKIFERFFMALFCLVVVLLTLPVYADEFERATEAVNRQDYETAYKMFVPLAENGHAAAQLVLGMMYFKGKGVQKNNIEACKWLLISETLGQEAGKKNRIFVERQMTSDQVSQAHKLANVWLKTR